MCPGDTSFWAYSQGWPFHLPYCKTSDGTHTSTPRTPGGLRGCEGNVHWLFVGPRVLPVLPQAAPTLQQGPTATGGEDVVPTSNCLGKPRWRLPSGGRHGQSWDEKHHFSWGSSQSWSDGPHAGTLCFQPWKHWGHHWASRVVTVVQKVTGDPFFHGNTMRWIFLDQHSLEGEIWQMDIT